MLWDFPFWYLGPISIPSVHGYKYFLIALNYQIDLLGSCYVSLNLRYLVCSIILNHDWETISLSCENS